MEGKSGGDGKLDDFVEEDCRAREVSVVSRRLHYPTVMHNLRGETCLAKGRECTTPRPVAVGLGGLRVTTYEDEG